MTNKKGDKRKQRGGKQEGRQKETEGRQGGHGDPQEGGRDRRQRAARRETRRKADTVTNKKGDKKGNQRKQMDGQDCQSSGSSQAIQSQAVAGRRTIAGWPCCWARRSHSGVGTSRSPSPADARAHYPAPHVKAEGRRSGG